MRGVFVGRIFPERKNLSIGDVTDCRFQISGREVHARLDIKSSSITLTLLNDIEPDDFATMRNSAQSLMRKFANFASFHCGIYNSTFFESFVDAETGLITILSHRAPLDDGPEPEKFEFDVDFNIIDTPAIAQALHAYNKALMEHDFTAKYALEAIEAVREYWGPDRWLEMRENLNLKEDTLKRHQTAATDQKHGRNSLQTWEKRRDQLRIAREAVRRLIAHVKLNAKLPIPDYPLY